jgi:potassium efflux system protein
MLNRARRMLPVVLGLLLLLAAVCVQAQPEDIDPTLDAARSQIDSAQKILDSPPKEGSDLPALRTLVLSAGAQAEAAAVALEPQLASVQARLDELGPLTPGQKEAPDVAALRAQLNKNRATLDAQLKRAKLLAVESEQTAGKISALRRSEFQARLGERTSSILSSLFWSELQLDLPSDLRRASRLFDALVIAAQASGVRIWSSVALMLALLMGLRWWVGRVLLKLTATRVPPGRLRRSLHAWTLVLLSAATAGLVAEVVYLGLVWTTPLPESLAPLLGGLVGVICFGGYVAGLGHALLLPGRPSWRLLPLPDVLALKLRWMPAVLAVLIVLTWAITRLTAQINASLVSTVAVDCIVALVMAVAMGLGLLQSERARRQALREPESAGWPPSPLWLTAVVGLGWLAVVGSLLALLLGYVAFGSFMVQQMAWIVVVLGTAYLLVVLIDDGFITLLSPKVGATDALDAAVGVVPGQPAATLSMVRQQAAVLLSGVGRLLVVLFTLMLLLAPFGEGPTELIHRVDQLHQGISIGEFQIRPMSVLQALLVMILSLAGVRMVKRWLTEHLLPTTSMDTGMQLSAATLFGYTGNVLAVSMGMAAVGIGLERIAWIASALSVGIGFGLQAVVQNFVSGLILLAERPVKVGDWVSLGGIEGDIRRINVRATEIQMADRSTVIVPNSEFITKTVRNVTHANPMGLVQLKLPMPLVTDADQVRSLILEAFEAHADVLENPAPNVQLDSIDSAGMLFNATAFVGTPRMAYGVRSALLFDVLRRLREADISMLKPPTLLLREEHDKLPGPAAQ